MKTRRFSTVLFVMVILLFTGCFTQNEEKQVIGEKLSTRGFTSVYTTMFLRGTNNGWATSAMTLTNNNEWTIKNVKFGNTTTERFKFDVYGNWATNFGVNGVPGGKDIFVTAGKTYDITFNDSTKKYTITESVLTKCDVTIILNDLTSNSAVSLSGAIAKLTGTAITAVDVVLTPTSSAIAALTAGTYTLTLDTTVKAGDADYKVTGTKSFIISPSDKNISFTLDVTKEKLVKGTANISINVTGSAISDFMTLYNSDNSLLKIYKEGTSITTEKTVNSIGLMTLPNLLEGNYRAVVDYNANGKKYFGETTFAITKTSITYSGILNVTYTENKIFLKTYPTMNFRGTPNGWSTTPMALIADYTWEIKEVKTGTTATERFKFDVKGDWSINFGKDGGIQDIPLNANSVYDITFNDSTKKYTITKIPTLTISSTTATVKPGTLFTLPSNGIYTKDGVSTTTALTWIPAVNTTTLGTTVYSATSNGLTVTFTIVVSDAFVSTYPIMYFRGTPNKWETTKMNLIGDNLWQVEADFSGVVTGTNPDRFKFDTKGDWSINFGDNEMDGIAESGLTTKDIFVKSGEGKYLITFNDKTKVYTVEKKDTTKPVITLKGDSIITIGVGNSYIDTGATAIDNIDGDISDKIVTTSAVNSNVIGSYSIKYNVIDKAGNNAIEAKRTINVVDLTKPIITLLGESTVTIGVGSSYIDFGATASDNTDGNISNKITTISSVNTAARGKYTITYNVIDNAGNTAVEVVRTVKVVDLTKPVITLLGNDTVTITAGSIYADAGATAIDNIDGDLTTKIVVTNTVNIWVAGVYIVRYNVADNARNTAVEVTRIVKVIDNIKPTITLKGNAVVNVIEGTIYSDAGATASDNIDGDLSNKIIISNTVNTSVIGTYIVKYNVMDNARNTALEVTRTVNVKTGYAMVSCGAYHSMILKKDGTAWATGYNSDGQLGDGTNTNKSTPVLVMTDVVSVSTGKYISMFIKKDGILWATGYNGHGQLGDGTSTNRTAPIQIMNDVASVSHEYAQTMILKKDSSLWETTYSTPIQIASDVASVSSGADHTMFIKKDGSLWGTGYNNYGQLGTGAVVYFQHSPIQIMSNVASVSAGDEFTMFLKKDGTLWSAGNNRYGQLGDGTTIDRSTPVQIMSDVASVSAGSLNTLILKKDNTLWEIRSSKVYQIASEVASISSGGMHSMIIKKDGSLWATGWNSNGQLGDGTTTEKYDLEEITF